jgi:nucleotide-binding universal stress UspA family protein
MAEFLMTMAVERATKQGVQARYVIRQGEFEAELAAAAQEEQASLVVLGHPGEEGSTFELGHLRELIGRLQAETGIPFCILPEQ